MIRIGFIWGESDEQLTKLVEQIGNSVQFEELCRNNIGTVITSHAGPTTFGVGYFCDDA